MSGLWRLAAALCAGADPEDRIGRASRCQAGGERDQADPAPRCFRANENQRNQNQADDDPQNPVEIADIAYHDEAFPESVTWEISLNPAHAAIRTYTEHGWLPGKY